MMKRKTTQRRIFDKSFITEAQLKARREPPTEATKELVAAKELIKKLEQRIKTLENKMIKVTNLLQRHNSKLISLNSDLSTASTSIDTIKTSIRRKR